MGKSTVNRPFSVDMLVSQRVAHNPDAPCIEYVPTLVYGPTVGTYSSTMVRIWVTVISNPTQDQVASLPISKNKLACLAGNQSMSNVKRVPLKTTKP